jgi:protoheme IX farnesyltransferase
MRLPPSTAAKASSERQKNEAIKPRHQDVVPGGHGLRVKKGNVMRTSMAGLVLGSLGIEDTRRSPAGIPAAIPDYRVAMMPTTNLRVISPAGRASDRPRVAGVAPSVAGISDYLTLMKPRVMSLVVFTALVGLLVAPGHVHPLIGLTILLCIMSGAGAAAALNMWYDADIDALMIRTACRPIPRGRVRPRDALAFGLTLATASVAVLGLLVSVPAALLLAFTIFFYVVVYTMWLKRSTPQNIVIGGAAGAFPPMIGWIAATGGIGIEPLLLFLIIFLWTPPHFWALSLYRCDDYARAGIPMLPVVAGKVETKRQIRIYTLLLVPTAVLLWPLGSAGAIYGVVAVAAGAIMIGLALRLRTGGDGAEREAKRLFAFSILYLFLLFAALLLDAGTGPGQYA